MADESEGWNTFAMLALMTLIGPFLYWVGSIDAIAHGMRTDAIVWSPPVLALLAGELAVIAAAVVLASWVHARKPSFL